MILKLHLVEPLKHLAAMLSECPSFQTLTGTTTPAEATKFIHFGYAEDEDGGTPEQAAKPFPRALVGLQAFARSKDTIGSFATEIGHSLYLEAEPLPAVRVLSHSDRYIWWLQICQQIIDELTELAADLTRLNIEDISDGIIPQMKSREENEDRAEHWQAAFVVEAAG